VCGSITPPPSWPFYQSLTLYAVTTRWNGSEFDYPMFAISTFRHPRTWSVFAHRESGQLHLEKCAQTLKESGAIFTLFGRLIFGEMSVFDDALSLHFSFCQ
jgi:hypothetical protein